jgi:peptide deformylase
MQKKQEKILTIDNKEEENFLRQKTQPFIFSQFTKREINELIQKMRMTMIAAEGIGLAANQIGLNFQVFVAQLPKEKSVSSNYKFYAIFNPKIIKISKKEIVLEEGCLSVPGGYFGTVPRAEKITLIGQDKNGKPLKIKAWGLLARVFQHEIDHLNGILYIDKAKDFYKFID